MSFSLTGHVALITGSSKGLGRTIALTLAAAGAKVVINYHRGEERARKTMDELTAKGGLGLLVQADVTDAPEVAALTRRVREELGPIDILVPNATCDQPILPFEDYTWDHYQAMIDFFIKSPFLLTKQCLAGMKEQKWGRIINITSSVYHRSHPNFSAYVAAKGAQIGWSRSMATELAQFGITVNTIAPGWIPTERHAKDPQEMKDVYRALIPADRWGIPEDVAYACLYYASEEASFVTGQTLCVNGGMTPW